MIMNLPIVWLGTSPQNYNTHAYSLQKIVAIYTFHYFCSLCAAGALSHFLIYTVLPLSVLRDHVFRGGSQAGTTSDWLSKPVTLTGLRYESDKGDVPSGMLRQDCVSLVGGRYFHFDCLALRNVRNASQTCLHHLILCDSTLRNSKGGTPCKGRRECADRNSLAVLCEFPESARDLAVLVLGMEPSTESTCRSRNILVVVMDIQVTISQTGVSKGFK